MNDDRSSVVWGTVVKTAWWPSPWLRCYHYLDDYSCVLFCFHSRLKSNMINLPVNTSVLWSLSWGKRESVWCLYLNTLTLQMGVMGKGLVVPRCALIFWLVFGDSVSVLKTAVIFLLVFQDHGLVQVELTSPIESLSCVRLCECVYVCEMIFRAHNYFNSS